MRNRKNRKQRRHLNQGKKKRTRAIRRIARPRTADEYFSKPERFQNMWNRVVHALSKMRTDRLSLYQASRESGVASSTVVRWGGSALHKRKNGQYAVRASDHLLRVLLILTIDGLREIAVADSRQASVVSGHWAAVHRYLATGDSSALRKYRHKYIKDTNGARVRLLTDVEELDRLGAAGVLSFESLYAKAA